MGLANDLEKSSKRSIWLVVLMYGGPVYLMDYTNYSTWTNAQTGYKQSKSKPSQNIFDYPMIETFNPDYKDGYICDRSWWDYCGGRACISKELCIRFLEDIPYGINWDVMNEPEDSIEHEFNGTDEPTIPVPIMTGIVIMNNGNKYPWVTNFNLDMQNLKNLLSFIKEWEDKTDEDVLELISQKMNKAFNGRWFDYDMTQGYKL